MYRIFTAEPRQDGLPEGWGPSAGANVSGAGMARVGTVAFQGVEVLHIDVEMQIGAGMPTFTIVATI